MAQAVAELEAKLTLNLSQFQSALQTLDQNVSKMRSSLAGVGESTEKTQTAVDKAKTAVEQLGIQSSLLDKVFTLLKNPLTIAATAFVVLEETMRRAKDAAIANALAIQQMMAVSGLSASAADNLADTFKVLGFEGDAATLAMFRMANEIETGAAGLGRIGIAVRNSAGELKAEGDLFLEVRDRISQLGSASERNAALVDIFGRAGRQLAPIFAMSREEFDRWMTRAGMLSPWSAEAQAKTMDLVRAQNALSEAWKGMFEELGVALAGPAAGFANFLTDVVLKTKEAIEWTGRYADYIRAHPFSGTLFGFLSTPPAPAGAPAPGEGGAAPGGPAGITRPTAAEFQATQAVLGQNLLAMQAYYQRLALQRQIDVSAQRTDQRVALDGLMADLKAREQATSEHFVTLRNLTAQQYGAESAAGIAHLAELAGQETAAMSAITQARLAGQAQLAAITFAERKQQLEQSIAGWVAMADEEFRLDEIRLKEEEKVADEMAKLFEEQRIVGTQAWAAIADAQISGEEDALKALDEATTKVREFFKAGLDMQTQLGGLSRQGAGFAAAGVPFDVTGAQQRLVEQRLGNIFQQQAEWQQLLKNLDEGSDGYNRMKANIAGATAESARLQEQLAKLQTLNTLKGVFSDIFGALNRAVSTTVTGIIQGTTTMKDAFNNLGQSILLSIQEMLIKRAFKQLEEAFNSMLDSMDTRAVMSTALRFLTSLFPSLSTPSAPTPAPVSSEPGAMQHGGIVTSSRRVLVGEAGPEAVIPLDSVNARQYLGGGGGGGPLVVVNNYSSAQVETRESTTGDSRKQIEILITDVTNKGLALGTFDRTLMGVFGVTRQGTSR